MIGQIFDTMSLASTKIQWFYNHPLNAMSWKVL